MCNNESILQEMQKKISGKWYEIEIYTNCYCLVFCPKAGSFLVYSRRENY